ncbi:hypothetical protein ADK65_35970 [Streptomyces sp. NRRL B-1140]|uniref:hypothetical protein n=1 Tax=Streptomyces sp. NRRL B-1140 TaxID=1415549 RepID=UPI0006AEFAB3|nr:hypothetical protein [Streptomyces sp. NRRL B-1140]KOV90892.1 hypothetical protein ADK65_35970 [Streptomyces sp. NRRL B-1140]
MTDLIVSGWVSCCRITAEPPVSSETVSGGAGLVSGQDIAAPTGDRGRVAPGVPCANFPLLRTGGQEYVVDRSPARKRRFDECR